MPFLPLDRPIAPIGPKVVVVKRLDKPKERSAPYRSRGKGVRSTRLHRPRRKKVIGAVKGVIGR